MSRADEEFLLESKAKALAAGLGHDLGPFTDGHDIGPYSGTERARAHATRSAPCRRCGYAVFYDRTVASLRLRGVPVIDQCGTVRVRR